MELYFLGTCACDFSPRLKTDLKDKFDKDARRSSAMMIGDRYLIDCGVHTLESLTIAKRDISKITDVLITHLHLDHFNAENLAAIAKGRSTPLQIWVREGAKLPAIGNVRILYMKQFESYRVGELTVTPIPANHDPEAYPEHFIIEGFGKKIFYGCDGGWFLNPSFIFMKKASFDLMVIDSTVGDYDGDFRIGEHNSIPMIRMMLPSLKTTGAITDSTKIILSHLAPSLHASHDETEEIAKGFGATVAYDGMSYTL